MPNKTKIWLTDSLKKMGLKNTQERAIKYTEYVEVECQSCGIDGKTKMAYILDTHSRYGRQWTCKDCLRIENSNRGKKLTKENNPFHGKKHTNETKNKMSISSQKRWDTVDQDEKNYIGERMRSAAYDKYGGNPMSDHNIREKHLASIRSFFEDEIRFREARKKTTKTNIEKYGSSTYIHSEFFEPSFTSKMEDEVSCLFKSLGCETRKRRKDHVELDVFVEGISLAVECNGAYWHSELFKPNNYHLKKTEYCESEGISLIQIYDHEWEKRRDQVINFLTSKTGKLDRIYARKCNIITVDNEIAQNFADQYHIQGKTNGSILCLALTYGNEILSVAIFGKHHRQYDRVALKRFVTKNGVLVIGGLGKISKYASKVLDSDIITWCDRRLTSGESYVKSGWTPEEVLPPSYFYIKNGRYFCSKQARRKSAAKTPDGMTEREHAQIDGLLRVYDCGKIRMRYSRPNKNGNN